MSLKLATDAAAAAGERLPSERDDVEDDGHVEDGIFGNVFPALGSSRTTSATRRGERSERTRKTSRGVDAVASARIRVGSAPSSGTSGEGAGPLGTNLPTQFDWSDVVDFGEVVHQGKCAGCWAYSTAAVIEAARLIDARATAAHSGDADAASRLTTERLSPHALIDCDDLDRGCATGNMASAYSWIKPPPRAFPRWPPTHAAAGTAPATSPRWAPSATRTSCAPRVLRLALARRFDRGADARRARAATRRRRRQRPRAAVLRVGGGGRSRLRPPASDDPLRAINHAAVLTGWGKDDEATGTWYWILRNTYGEHWGGGTLGWRLASNPAPTSGRARCTRRVTTRCSAISSARTAPCARRL